MSDIKQILDEIASYSGKNDKRDCLTKYKDNELLKKVIYAADSPRINYHIKKIPEYNWTPEQNDPIELEHAITLLDKLSKREFTGNQAREWLQSILMTLVPDDAYVIERIIDRNLKIGMDTGINKVIPKLVEVTPYMGAISFNEKKALKLFSNLKEGEYVISQIKADGTYRNDINQDGEVELLSRQGEVSFLKGTKFLSELSGFEDCVLNGELTIDGYDRFEANGMCSSMMDIIEKAEERGEAKTAKKKDVFEEKHGNFNEALAKTRFTVWDMITVDEYYEGKSDTPYKERFENLQNLIAKHTPTMIDIVETRFITTYAEAVDHFIEAQERGLEGTIIKSATDGWKDGKPSYQIKMKLEMNMDFRIIGFKYGGVGTKNEHVISTLLVESSCGQLKTNPSGMKEVQMKDVTARQEELLGTIVEMRCCGLSQNSKGEWSTMHPSVIELRPDKDTCDSLESALEIQEMAKNLKELIK